MFTILVSEEIPDQIEIEDLRKRIFSAVEFLDLSEFDFSIAIETDAALKGLNKKYIGNDEVTDVLAFSSVFINPENGKTFLGDIVVSWDRTKKQAQSQTIPIELELLTLIIHGLLHLLEFDHQDQEELDIMFNKQHQVLRQIAGDLF